MSEWTVHRDEDGTLRVSSADFSHDAELIVTGDFADPQQAEAYANDLAARLNAKPRDVLAIGSEYVRRFLHSWSKDGMNPNYDGDWLYVGNLGQAKAVFNYPQERRLGDRRRSINMYAWGRPGFKPRLIDRRLNREKDRLVSER